MTRIGIDPAVTKDTAITVVLPDGTLHFFLVDTYDAADTLHHLRPLIKGPVTLTIEGQEIYKRSNSRHKNILDLAESAGFFRGVICSNFEVVKVQTPLPKAWKGQVSSDMYRTRALKYIPQLAAATSGMTKQEQEDLAHSTGLAFFPKKLRNV